MRRLTRIVPLAAVAIAVLPAPALAARSPLDIHAIFEGGRTSGFTVGEPLQVNYQRGNVRTTKVCWTPAPIDRPKCSRGFGAPARAGTQRFGLHLSNGKIIIARRQIRPAAKRISGNPAAVSHPVPYSFTCSTPIFGNAALSDRIGTATADDHAGVYYRESPSVLQVFVYRTMQPGFARDGCLTPGLSG